MFFSPHFLDKKFLRKLKCNISKALSQRIDSFSEDDVNTIMESMQGIIDEGSDHIKDLELKIKTQGTGIKFMNGIITSFVSLGKNDHRFTL